MKKLLAVISLASVLGVVAHAQQSEISKAIEQILKRGQTKSETQQAEQKSPILAFVIYDEGIIVSQQGSPDITCNWYRKPSLDSKNYFKLEMFVDQRRIVVEGDP